MFDIIQKIKDWFRGYPVFGSAARSNQWPKVRKEHLLKEPNCIICGGNKKITVHHLRPFHIDKSLELNDENLATLCEGAGNGNHHLIYGHWGNYRTKWNPDLRREVPLWYNRFSAKTEDEAVKVAD